MLADEGEWAGTLEDRQLYTAYESLMSLMESHLRDNPDEFYLRTHFKVDTMLNQARSVRWYLRWLPHRGRILDWGCRFAPDSFFIRQVRPGLELHGCDMDIAAGYRRFHEASGVQVKLLTHPVSLPYPDGHFDAVVGAGVLEHVPWDYESLKELHRILKPQAPLIITYLPYLRSQAERENRQRGHSFHRRLYSTKETAELLFRSGFYPRLIDYQERATRQEGHERVLRAMASPVRRARRKLKIWLLDWLRRRSEHSTLCAVAEKRDEM